MSKSQRRSKAAKSVHSAGMVQPPGLAQRLAKAFSHPLRAELLTMLNETPGSAKDLKERLEKKGIEETLNLVAYHVRVLDEIDCVELVDTETIRGATKKIYRGTTRMLLDEGIWPNLSEPNRVAISAGAIGETTERVQHALEEGTFDKRKDRAIINLKMSLDERGWKDILKVIKEAYERCEDIEPEAINRTPDPHGRFCTTISLLAYESPEPRKGGEALERDEEKAGHLRPSVQAIGLAVRTLREEQGMSVAELAERAGTDETTIELVEQGDSVSFDLLPSLAAGLEVETHDLVNLTEQIPTGKSEDTAALTGMGLALKELRAERHLTQTNLAKKAELSLSELTQIEAGKIEASCGALRRLARALYVDLPQLLQEGEMRER